MPRVSFTSNIWKLVCSLLAASLLAAGCSLPVEPLPPAPAPAAAVQASQPVPTLTDLPSLPPATQTSAPSATLTPGPTASLPPAETATPTSPPTPTPLPACELLRGVVLPEKASCKDGPGAMYLYVYGLNQGAVQDLIGRDDLGGWLLTRSHGDNVSCWVKADLLKTGADAMCLPRIAPDDFGLPRTHAYAPPTGLSAARSGDLVTVSWNAIDLRPGDDSLQTPYVIEAWVCRSGHLIFEPTGAYSPSAKIRDEAGCAEPSHARLMAVEKHGFTLWIQIPWPQAPRP